MLQPTRLISTPFAQEGEKTEIQNVTGEFDNSATYRLGFPPLTMQSIRLGGKPPKGTDFNGVLFDITENISFLCKGGRYQYNAGLSTLIGGYPEGSNLLLDDNVTEVVSIVAGNQNNPNTDMTGWTFKPNRTTAEYVLDASGETQQQVNYNGGAKWHSRVGGYQKNERVVLTNGDIVKSTIDGNTNDPNVNMTGWVSANAASQIFDESGRSQQDVNNVVISQFLTTDQFKIIIPEADDTGRLQRAFDESFEKQQTLQLVGDFNCSGTLYARHDFNGSSSKITFPLDYNSVALIVGAEKSETTTTRMTGKTIHFPNIETTKTSGTNDWTSNTGSCAIKIINPQECKMWFGTTINFEYGVYFLAYNTDANYNQYNFGRHVFHKRPMTFHVDGSVSVASMNQNTLTGGRFAASNTTSRIAGIYLMHFLITGGTLSSLNNNLILNPSVEGSADEYAMLFESQGTNISGLAYNTIIAPRLETGSVAGKKMAFRGNRVRWNRVMQGYGVEYDSVVNENGATVNTIFGSTGAMQFIGSLGNTAVGSFQNNSGIAFPAFAVYATGKTNLEMMDATANSVLYATSSNLYSRSATAKRWSLDFGNGKQEWFSASEVLLANLYAETGGLKSDYRLSLVQGLGVFGTVPPSSKRSVTGKKVPTTITEQNAVIDSIVAALSAYGLVSDDRTT